MTYRFFTPLSFLKLRGTVGAVLLCCGTLLVSVPAQASAAKEKVFCTNLPRAQWISEAQARERFRAQDYVLVKYKVSSGNCHEFYAVNAQGTVVESYLHPITGETVRSTRVPAPNKP
jgi:hypothetical protein